MDFFQSNEDIKFWKKLWLLTSCILFAGFLVVLTFFLRYSNANSLKYNFFDGIILLVIIIGSLLSGLSLGNALFSVFSCSPPTSSGLNVPDYQEEWESPDNED